MNFINIVVLLFCFFFNNLGVFLNINIIKIVKSIGSKWENLVKKFDVSEIMIGVIKFYFKEDLNCVFYILD